MFRVELGGFARTPAELFRMCSSNLNLEPCDPHHAKLFRAALCWSCLVRLADALNCLGVRL